MTVLSTDGILCNFTADDFEAFGIGGGAPTQPAAVLSSIAPTGVAKGAPNTTITLTGTGFVAGAVAKIVATNLATTFVSATQLTAVIPTAMLANTSSYSVTVVNPSAPASGSKTFTVT
jgi:trimeric autotransporter adhesin